MSSFLDINKTFFDATFAKYQINTPLRKAHFLTQCHHESMGFTKFEENLNYSVDGLLKTFSRSRISLDDCNKFGRTGSKPANKEQIANIIYGGIYGRTNLGNTAFGDGWKYRGAGIIQLTGKSNQTAYFKTVGVEPSIELLKSPQYAIDSAGWFWQQNKINQFADLDNLAKVRKAVNGGSIGLDECKALLTMYKLVFK